METIQEAGAVRVEPLAFDQFGDGAGGLEGPIQSMLGHAGKFF